MGIKGTNRSVGGWGRRRLVGGGAGLWAQGQVQWSNWGGEPVGGNVGGPGSGVVRCGVCVGVRRANGALCGSGGVVA